MNDLVAKLRAVKVRTPQEVMADVSLELKDYILMPKAENYAVALRALRNACAADKNSIQPEDFGLVRPLTFEETIRSRVEDYNRLTNPDGSKRELVDRRRLFTTFFDTAGAVVYKKGTTKFKVVPLSEHLVTLKEEDCKEGVLPVNYDDFSDYEELDSSASGVEYDKRLSREAILEHPAWRACVKDKELLREYRDIVFEVCEGPEEAMAFCVDKNPEEDHLRSLFVNSHDDSSAAGGYYELGDTASFLRVTWGDANE